MPKMLRVFCTFLMSVLMTGLPHVAWAEAATEMIPTSVVVEQVTRAQSVAKVEAYLGRTEIRSELVKRGVSPEEVSQRLAGLSDQELRQLGKQMDQAMYGGDGVVGVLIIVILVLLVIFLVKRV